jgi:ATP-dependent exoDNAse (exonuclease V) alpha subunit
MTQDKALEVLKTGKNVFLTGEPGAGKTYTINKYCDYLQSIGKSVAITASTGIAATHINGITIHSWSGIGIKKVLTDYDIRMIVAKPWIGDRIAAAQVLVIDEISMLEALTLDLIDRVVRVAKYSDKPFGGMQVIFVGDFFQLPPVSKEGPVEFAFESKAWRDADPTICYLTEQHRQDDGKFLDVLTALRNGTIGLKHIQILKSVINKKERPETKLYTHNLDVDVINAAHLADIEGKEKVYMAEVSGIPHLADILRKQCLSPERLAVKEGAVVMFTRNNFDVGYVNGTLGTVIGFDHAGFPKVQTKSGEVITAMPHQWSIDDHKGGTLAKMIQVPLRLAWAITVHKSQGMSLDSAIIDLSKAFEYGQGYVALSRVRSLEGLFLEGLNARALQMHPKIVKQDKIFRDQSETI